MLRAFGLVMYKLYYTNRAKKDAQLIKASNLKSKAEELLNLIAQDPYPYPPEFELLKSEFKGAISRRINKQHRQDDLPQERDEWL